MKETHKYIGKDGTIYRFDITREKTRLYIERFVNSKFVGIDNYSSTEYTDVRCLITENMTMLGAIREWS